MRNFHSKRPPGLAAIFLAVSLLNGGGIARAGEHYYPDLSTALRTGEPDGIGPFAAISVHDYPLGRAFVHGGQSPDLFIRTGRWTNLEPGIYLYKYITRREGVPVFGEPVRVQLPEETGRESDCVIFQDTDGETFGL
jgi:hypothetical protein